MLKIVWEPWNKPESCINQTLYEVPMQEIFAN
jgi:hypothetical protein